MISKNILFYLKKTRIFGYEYAKNTSTSMYEYTSMSYYSRTADRRETSDAAFESSRRDTSQA